MSISGAKDTGAKDADSAETPAVGPLYSLEELSQFSQTEMERLKIPSPGGRVSQTPTARTIRYYTSLGLVDRPSSYDGGLAQYGDRHLKQLLAIKVLQAEYLPLPEIQKQLYGRTDSELDRLIESVRVQEKSQEETVPSVESWLCSSVGAGLSLVVTDRAACRSWTRSQNVEDFERAVLAAARQIYNSL